MENKTISTVLDFLNQMEIYKILTGLIIGIYNILRKNLITIFKDDDVDKLFEIITAFDVLYIDYLEKRSHFDKSLITNLRDKILMLYKEKIEKQTQEGIEMNSI